MNSLNFILDLILLLLFRFTYSQIEDEFVKYMKYRRDVRFGEPIPDSIIDEMSRKKYALKSYANMKWCLAMYRAWMWLRNRIYPGSITVDLDNIGTISKEALVHDLSHFIVETRKKNGEEFPPKTLKHIILMIQMYLSSVGLVYEFLEDQCFIGLRNCLDNKMKINAKKGLGRHVRKADPLEPEHLEKLWDGGYLGVDTPRKLSNTILFLLGINFSLHAGGEHRALKRPGFDPQVRIVSINGQDCLEYVEDLATKTNQGGLKHEQLNAKNSVVYPCRVKNRCPVEIFKIYMSKLPVGSEPCLYLKCNSKKGIAKGGSWFLDRPIGKCTLGKVVARVTSHAKLEGFLPTIH